MRRDEVIRRLEQCAAEFERFGVVSVRLFGSTARDEADDGSDVDIIAEFKRPLTFRRFMGFRLFLEEQLETKVDLVTERGLRDRVRPQVERDAIRVA
mgnify:CR=1 FL=1